MNQIQHDAARATHLAHPGQKPTARSNRKGGMDSGRASLGTRIANLIAVLLPFAGIIAAGVLVWPFGLSWVPLSLLLVMYVLTGLGVTIGYHRLFTHQSFETNRVMTFIIGVLGSMAMEGPLLTWVQARVFQLYP